MSLLMMSDYKYGFDPMIPATFSDEDGLHLGHNGISAKFFSDVDFSEFNKHEFELFATDPYLRGKGEEFWKIPYFVYTGEDFRSKMWQLFYVSQKRGKEKGRLLYTILKPCPQYTCFCTCSKECGKKYVINSGTYKFYMGKDLQLPVDRCNTCREIRKIDHTI